MFPELNPDKYLQVQGMNITLVTTATSDEEALELLTLWDCRSDARIRQLRERLRRGGGVERDGGGVHVNKSVLETGKHSWLVNRNCEIAARSQVFDAPQAALQALRPARARCTGSSASAGFVSANWRTRD